MYDVAVVGGGISGCIAAIAAARYGANVILIERYGFLGGTLTACGTGPMMSFHADRLVHDGDELELLGYKWKVIATPGHTAGSVCYYLPEEEVLLSGDTLFQDSYGRTDLPTGSSRALVDSVLRKLFILPGDTMVYPGHGEPTTIGYEAQNNPIACYR